MTRPDQKVLASSDGSSWSPAGAACIAAPHMGLGRLWTRAWLVTIILAGLSTFSFLDRQVLALLLPDLGRDLHVSDLQFGFLSGPAFIIVYNLTLFPAAFLVDRWNRKWLVCIGAVIWTLMTIASGFAQTFNQLVVLRAGLAFGEALLGPAAISLIGDLFERYDRPLPTAAYITGSVIGSTGSAMMSAAALQLAGVITHLLPGSPITSAWRLTLIGVGLPGLMLGLLIILVAREPERLKERQSVEQAGAETLLAHLGRRGRLYAGAFVGYGLVGMVATALAIWGPSHLIRSFGLTQVAAGYLLGGCSLAAGLAGTVTLPVIFRRLIRLGKTDEVIRIVLAVLAAVVVAAMIGGFASSAGICVAGFSVVMFIVMGVGTLPSLIIQLYAPSHLRGRISAALFFLLYLLSAGLTPVLVPLLAHSVFQGASALGKAIGLVALGVGLLSIACFASIKTILRLAEKEASIYSLVRVEVSP